MSTGCRTGRLGAPEADQASWAALEELLREHLERLVPTHLRG